METIGHADGLWVAGASNNPGHPQKTFTLLEIRLQPGPTLV